MMGDRIARHFDVHAPPRLPNLDPAECRSRVENLLGPSLGNAIVAACDYFQPRDMTVRIQQIASVGVHHGVGPPHLAHHVASGRHRCRVRRCRRRELALTRRLPLAAASRRRCCNLRAILRASSTAAWSAAVSGSVTAMLSSAMATPPKVPRRCQSHGSEERLSFKILLTMNPRSYRVNVTLKKLLT